MVEYENDRIGIGKFLFWPFSFGIGIGKIQCTTIGFGIGIGIIQCITIGFAIGIGKVDLSGFGIDCQVLDFLSSEYHAGCMGSIRASLEPKRSKIGQEMAELRPIYQLEVV